MLEAKPVTSKQIGEYCARQFLGEETWCAWKADFDSLMAFRKSIKGKPDAYASAMLELNKPWIEFYQSMLFHRPDKDKCVCRSCSMEREGKTKQINREVLETADVMKQWSNPCVREAWMGWMADTLTGSASNA